ncbi:TauD/TfdA family dioxygenase [Herbaspirillum sp. RTI4]|uniref:TauD/TfdA family dioxygenase n=1 Tax=Herbaspirillum sp. RTI4 TaxID=3048640 RepID=UPI002AB4BE04|nr:TauD/TfdA family dioxygenase [Herbaspirillum sp. RTI4]MDY7579991.1 TauD/TfdA family dioxygenase [Herbaspirillum sp. RTI4]MEA9982806.1 TauD/TfdA family dioxygenase [Herbaspirillum sp. RTI4]
MPNFKVASKPESPYVHCLAPRERLSIEAIVDELLHNFGSVETAEFADACSLSAQQLPRRLRELAHRFKYMHLQCGAVLLRGIAVDDHRIGPSPQHWDAPWRNPPTLREEVTQCLLSAVLGDIFGWRTQENGRFLRHIVPVLKESEEQLGGGSSVTLVWHNEEAFHECRGDFLSILCYRNDEQAQTILSYVGDIAIPDEKWAILAAPRYTIRPDKSHFPDQNVSAHWRLDDHAFARIQCMYADPQPVPVLSGSREKPFIQVDEAFMCAIEGDAEAAEAFDWLLRQFDDKKNSIVMQPGDMLWIDNKRAVHGRSVYLPHYGPRQRWLRRVNVTLNLRASLPYRESALSRHIV